MKKYFYLLIAAIVAATNAWAATYVVSTACEVSNPGFNKTLIATQTRSVQEKKYVPNGHNFVSNEGWTVIAFDSEEPSDYEGTGGGKAIHAIDGNPSTYWHTQYSDNTQPAHPHYISVDMGKEETLSLFQYVPRPGGHNGTVKGYKLYLSNEKPSYPDNLGTLIAEGEFTGDKTEAKDITFAETKARYFTFVATSAVGGEVFASAGELRVGKPGIAWSVVEVDSYEPQEAAHGGEGKHAIDNNFDTYWHTQWWDSEQNTVAEAPLPHHIIVDMGASYPVNGFEYYPRKGGPNGTVKGYEFYVSEDGSNWGDAVSVGTFEKDGDDKTAREVAFTAKKGRYFKFVATSEVRADGNATVVGEIRVLMDDANAITETKINANIWFANGAINVRDIAQPTVMQIFNMQGQKVLERKIDSNNVTVPVTFAPGVYSVVLRTNQGKVATQKIVVR